MAFPYAEKKEPELTTKEKVVTISMCAVVLGALAFGMDACFRSQEKREAAEATLRAAQTPLGACLRWRRQMGVGDRGTCFCHGNNCDSSVSYCSGGRETGGGACVGGLVTDVTPLVCTAEACHSVPK